MQLNILTFNWHEPYLCHLARLGHQFFVVAPETAPGQLRQWDSRMRPIPSNCRLITSADAQSKLKDGNFDLALTHNVKDLMWLREYDLPKLNVFHCRLSTEIALGSNVIDKTEYLGKLRPVLDGAYKVFISENKKQDWGLDGEVIVHGIDPDEYYDYTGTRPYVLRVGNLLKEMDLARGYTISEKILENFPAVTLGLNPNLPQARLSNGFDDLREHYRDCRLYLNTTLHPYEDGYNLSLLEAMATGMPVVSYENPTSPIQDGVNGFISGDLNYLREQIRRLQNDPPLAKALGQAARETVLQRFSMPEFLKNWEQAIQSCLMDYLKSRGFGKGRDATPFCRRERKNILMDFVAHPATTAYYLERALRQRHNVMTCGAVINDEVKQQWDLKALNWPIEPQDFFRGTQDGVQKVIQQLPADWSPDFYLYVETGLSGIPDDLHTLDIPRVAYLIDTHIHLEKHKQIASHFDVVFLAQREYIPEFKNSGLEHVYWLPLACDPEIHGKVDTAKQWDVGFVGSITSAHARRKSLLDRIDREFNLHVDRKFMDEMIRVFCESRIVFNNAIKNDLNMRVFEALCSGSFLLTDPAEGLFDFFKDGEHLGVYTDEGLEDQVRYYLNHPEEREAIAEAGRREVLARHTYAHRVDEMMGTLNQVVESILDRKDKSQNKGFNGEYYHHVRHDIVKLIPPGSQCILEIGCGAGKTGEYVKSTRGGFYAGVELDEESARQARNVLDDVISGNIEVLDLPYEAKSFDCILCGDVLEHLVEPEKVLARLKPLLKDSGVLIASLPNVQFFGLVHQLVEGNWTYEDEGILDRTHLRFFTFKEMQKLFEKTGFEIVAVDETLDPQYEDYIANNPTSLKVGKLTIERLTPEELKRFFVFQYKLVVKPVGVLKSEENGMPNHRDNEKISLELARSYEAQGHYKESFRIFQEIQKTDPNHPEVLSGLGNGYLRAGNLRLARDSFIKSLGLDRNQISSQLGMGLIALQENRPLEAEDHFQEVLKLDTCHDRAHAGMGLVYQAQKKLGQARRSFVQALEINPENHTALTSLLQISYEDREFEAAEKAIKSYLSLHPANLNMMFGLAGVLLEQEKLEACAEILEQILIFEPSHQDALALLNKINSLKTIP